MLVFLFILTIGFVYEWKKGALDWNNKMIDINKDKQIPDEFKQFAKDFADKGFITTSFDNLVNWARTGSLIDDIWSCMLCS